MYVFKKSVLQAAIAQCGSPKIGLPFFFAKILDKKIILVII